MVQGKIDPKHGLATKRIWVFLTSKQGDNTQSLNLAYALNLPFSTPRLSFRVEFEESKPAVKPSLHHLDLAKSDELKAPWPDLIIVTGRRPSMAALWVKEQSGGRTRIVLIGKPKACFDQFDLVVAPAHYRMPEARPNLLRIGLPLIKVSGDRLEAAQREWTSRFEGLARPLTVLCFGGSTGARPLDLASVRHIMRSACRVARSGTLYVLTSRRTPSSALGEIRAQMPSNGRLYTWQERDSQNPYLGLLAAGDRFVVTGDSISMLVEIARLGKPLAIAALPPEGGAKGLARRIVLRFGGGSSRDFDLFHRYLYEHGWAVPLGNDFVVPASLPPDDSEIAAERVRQLLSFG